MATTRWLGRAAATFDKWTATFSLTWAAGDTATFIINGKSLTLTVGTTATTAQIAIEAASMWNGTPALGALYSKTNSGSKYPEFAEITAVTSGSTVVLTCDTAGVPVTITVSSATVGTGDLVIVHTTTATGPNYADNANNWSAAALLAIADDVIIEGTDVPILYGMDQSAVTLTSLTIGPTFSGTIGLPEINESGGYTEYRDEYWKVSATTATIDAANCGRCKINVGSVQTAVEVRATGGGLDSDTPALLLKGTHASNALDVQNGSVGVSFYGDETSTLTTLRMANGTVTGGAGLTTATAELSGGTLLLQKAPTTLTQRGGESTINGSAAVTTLTATRGTVHYNSSGTIATAAFGGTTEGALLDCSGDLSSRTITNITLHIGGRVFDPHGTLTLTNGITRGTNVQELAAA